MQLVVRDLMACLIVLQMLLVSFAGAVTRDGLHVETVHELAVDHHHDDAFLSHFDHDDESGLHVHVADNVQSLALVAENVSSAGFHGRDAQLSLRADQPRAVFLEGLLRPPQLLL